MCCQPERFGISGTVPDGVEMLLVGIYGLAMSFVNVKFRLVFLFRCGGKSFTLEVLSIFPNSRTGNYHINCKIDFVLIFWPFKINYIIALNLVYFNTHL